MEVYKIKLRNHLQNASTIVYGILTCIFFPLFFSLLTGDEIKSLFWISGVIFLVLVLPAFIIHINYYLSNKGDIIYYDLRKGRVTIEHNGESTEFDLDDIDHVKRFMSFNLAANRIPVMPFDEYNHSIIYLKNGKSFVITSLLVYNLTLPLEENKIIIKENIYRLVL